MSSKADGFIANFVFKTKLVNKSLSPKWDETFTIPLVGLSADDFFKTKMVMKVFDKTKDKVLGTFEFMLRDMEFDEEDSFTEMIKRSNDEKFNFPYVSDNTQSVAKNFGAQKTPHAFVIWKEKGEYTIKYNGAIDDNGADPDKVKEHYIEKAVDALLHGKEVETKETKSLGCQIHFRN